MNKQKKIFIIAGPNGAGKTTFATEFLPKEAECPNFINADLIAAGINPFRPDGSSIQAAKIMINMMNKYLEKGESFSFETTLSGRIYARLIPQWQKKGYNVKMFYLKLPDPEFAIARVRQRVKEGGHNVPDDVIRRRFKTGWSNFETLYKDLVNEWALYDNAGERPILLNEGSKNV